MMCRIAWIVYAAEIRSIEFFGETRDLAFYEKTWVGFYVETFDTDSYDSSGNEKNPKYPTPADSLGYETWRLVRCTAL